MKKTSASNSEQSFLSEYLKEIKGMIEEFKHELNEGSWNNPYKFSAQGRNNTSSIIPVEIWETSNKYYISAYLPGAEDIEHTQVSSKDDHTLIIKAELPSRQPIEECSLVHSEVPDHLEREICLLQPVSADSFMRSLKNGVLTVVVNKQAQDFDLPIDF